MDFSIIFDIVCKKLLTLKMVYILPNVGCKAVAVRR
jgi:hypothetical protein